jgi:O-antigen/teichoic acid export membrane protein
MIKTSAEYIDETVVTTASTNWAKPVLQVLGSQMLFQLMGFGFSLILIRTMIKEDYAVYTILTSIQAILAILADSGVSVGFQAIGGRVWHHKKRLASLIKTASMIKWRVIFFAFAIAGGYGLFILIKQNFPGYQIALFLVSLMLIVAPEIQKGFLLHALLLKKDVLNVQLSNIISQGLRLFLISAVFFLFNKNLSIQVVLCITIFSIWISFIFLLRKSKQMRNESAEESPVYRRILLHYLKMNWHTSAFYAFQGQIAIFLIGMFGSTGNLADLGALSRFSMIFIIMAALSSNILSPAFGRTRDRSKLLELYSLTLISLATFSLLAITIVSVYPEPFLWVLGDKYQDLGYELVLVFIGGFISLAVGTIFSFNSAKGWIKFSPVWEIPLNIVVLITGLFVFDISQLSGVLYLSILSATATLLLYAANSLAGFKRL